MTERSVLTRATTLAEMAPHSSVSVGLLSGREGEFPDGRLTEPPVSYLGDTEAVAYALTNRKRGIGLGTKRNRTTPAPDRGSVTLVTGRRTLCLVGGSDGDELFEVPHESVADVSYRTGLLANRFVLRTPRKQYHCWVGRSTPESTLDQASAYVSSRLPETADSIDKDDGANRLTYRGQPIPPENHPNVATGTGNARTE